MNDEQKMETLKRLAPRKPQAGFTLIELSIVIGLIAVVTATVSIGAKFMEQARLRKQIAQIVQFETGVQNFRIKYNCFPGDCADPTAINGYIYGGVTYQGDGNGYLPQAWNNNENTGFWVHLYASSMIDDKLVSSTAPTVGTLITPRMVLNPSGIVNAVGSILYAQNVLLFDTTTVTGSMAFEQIKYIDTKMDDGVAASGNIRSTGYGSGNTTVYDVDLNFPFDTTNNSGSTQCVSGGSYSGLATSSRCNMVYILSNN